MREGTRLGVFSIFVIVISLLKRVFFTCAVTALFSGAAFADVAGCPEGTVISSIQYEGLEHTKKRVVDRELLNKAGETFSAEKFELEKRRLQDLDLFTSVSARCDGGTLTYSFVEIFRWIPSPAGKETDRDGLMIGLALAHLHVLGEDIRAEVQYRTSTDPFLENNEYAFYVSSPYLFGVPLGWNFEFLRTDSYDDIHGYQDDSWLVDLDLDYEMLPHLSLLGTVAGRILKNADFLPEFGLGFAFDFRDSKLDTRKGVYYEYMLTHVGLGDESDCDMSVDKLCKEMGGENYWELLTDARAYWTLSRFVTGATALARYRPGDVKFYDYYYHGGPNTFRGRGGSALGGKEDEADSVRLGVHEVLLTLEERFVLMERHAASVMGVNFFYGVQLVAGFDGSLLWDSGRPGWDDYEGAVYGGLHLVIPALDRIRFEVGYRPDRGEPAFYFGLFDKVTSSRWRSR